MSARFFNLRVETLTITYQLAVYPKNNSETIAVLCDFPQNP